MGLVVGVPIAGVDDTRGLPYAAGFVVIGIARPKPPVLATVEAPKALLVACVPNVKPPVPGKKLGHQLKRYV